MNSTESCLVVGGDDPAAASDALPSTPRRKDRILIIAEMGKSTGFARVTHAIVPTLLERFEVHQFGLDYTGRGHALPWAVYRGTGRGRFVRLAKVIQRIRPKIILIIYDAFHIDQMIKAAIKNRVDSRTVCYVAVDTSPVDCSWLRWLPEIDCTVAYTDFGRSVLQQGFTARFQRDENPEPNFAVIPHGVDLDVFYPLGLSGGNGNLTPADIDESRIAARRALFPKNPEMQDAFIVLNANRNQPRKRIDVTMKAFALFARDKRETARLYLHMGSRDIGWDILALAKRFDIEKQMILTDLKPAPPSVSVERLNLIYNACDIGLNTSTGEGWGLVNFEHAATGVAQILPRHSACAEIWDGACALVEPTLTLTNHRTMREEPVVSPEGVAAALEALWADRTRRLDLAMAGHRMATSERYRWSVIAKQWLHLLENLAESEPKQSDPSSAR
jgi:glycosyltransferase involved in cell wall biosynthesis